MIASTTDTLWQATLDQLQLQLTKATFDTWIKNTRLVKCKDHIYTVGVQNPYAKDWLQNRLSGRIEQTLGNLIDTEVEVEFVLLSNSDHKQLNEDISTVNTETSDSNSNQNAGEPANKNVFALSNSNGNASLGTNMRLRANYTFDRFVVGSSNRLAHAASIAVAEKPGQAYNPLFLYGGVGLGKTHLLQAIAHTAKLNDQRVIYVSSETFTNDFINAIRRQSTEDFRSHYRSTDFLLIDDIQFIAGKESTQEEFFHTFNDLHSSGGQIVLTSDRVPKLIPTLEDRLSSRFEWGLLADIQSPDLETRLAILRFKADEIGVHVPNDVMEFIARRAQNNIRELEGALNKVVAHAALNQETISLEQAKTALRDLVQRRASITIAMVIESVTQYYAVSTGDLVGNGRSKRISGPRQMVMYLAREETKSSLPQIGEALGGRDHTTIMYGCDKVTKLVEQNEQLRRDAMQIREVLYQKVA